MEITLDFAISQHVAHDMLHQMMTTKKKEIVVPSASLVACIAAQYVNGLSVDKMIFYFVRIQHSVAWKMESFVPFIQCMPFFFLNLYSINKMHTMCRYIERIHSWPLLHFNFKGKTQNLYTRMANETHRVAWVGHTNANSTYGALQLYILFIKVSVFSLPFLLAVHRWCAFVYYSKQLLSSEK